jgi:hypothetical protein
MDRWDVFGVAALAGLGASVWALTSWPWALMLWSVLGLAAYGVHDIRQMSQMRKGS